MPEALWYPQTGPQSLAYVNLADELFFGGAAGGGKTDFLIGLGATAHQRTLILRSEAAQLTGIKDRIRAIIGHGDRLKEVGHGGILRTRDGRMVELAGCRTWADANSKWRGRDHDLKGYDELPTMLKTVYIFLNGWNRSPIPGQRSRVVGTGNPPGRPEEEWVIEYWKEFIQDYTEEPGTLVWYARVEEDKFVRVENGKPFQYKKETIYPRSRTFIPARLEDNPILETTGYRQVLQNMPEPYRSQLLYGDMNIGKMDGAYQLIPTAWVDAAQKRWRPFEEAKPQMLTCVACDPARGGDDCTAIAKRYGQWIAPLATFPGKVTKTGPEVAQLILQRMEHLHSPCFIDITGTAGGGAYDSLQLINPKGKWYPFVAAGTSTFMDKSGRIKMRNKRTEAYWRLREALDPANKEPLALPPGHNLKVELCAADWHIYTSGAGLEEKEDIIKKIGHSPDEADAVAMTFMDGDASNGWVDTNKNSHDYHDLRLPQHPWKY